MNEKYAFNSYGCETSGEALRILEIKLKASEMNAVVITNGANDGEGFVRACRRIQQSLPIIVFCSNKTYHQQWLQQYGDLKSMSPVVLQKYSIL